MVRYACLYIKEMQMLRLIFVCGEEFTEIMFGHGDGDEG